MYHFKEFKSVGLGPEMNILQEIQADLVDTNVSLPNILRKARVLAHQLKSRELEIWATSELDGYKLKEDLPNYRVIRTTCTGYWTNGIYAQTNAPVPMFKIKDKDLIEYLTKFFVFPGVRTIEQYAAEQLHFYVDADVVSYANLQLQTEGFGFTRLEYMLDRAIFAQILDTLRNRLLDYVLKLDETWSPKGNNSPEVARNLFYLTIYNSQGGNIMSMFDQRGQQVNYQYNAAGDINIHQVQDRNDLIKEIEKLRQEIGRAKDGNAIPSDTATEADYHILQAKKEVQKATPNEHSFQNHITNAVILLKDIATVAGLVSALNDLMQLVQLAKIF